MPYIVVKKGLPDFLVFIALALQGGDRCAWSTLVTAAEVPLGAQGRLNCGVVASSLFHALQQGAIAPPAYGALPAQASRRYSG